MRHVQGTVAAPSHLFRVTREWRATSRYRDELSYVPTAFGYRLAKDQGSPAGIQCGLLNTKVAPLGMGAPRAWSFGQRQLVLLSCV